MKKLLFFFAALALTAGAQPTNKMNYQSVARNSSGAILSNQLLGIRLTIENGSGGPSLYVETQTPTTNQFGLFTLQIGGGTVVSGVYASINWSAGNQWLKVEMDPTGGNSYVNMGESQLLSVPYANYAASAAGTLPAGSSGQTLRHDGTNWVANNTLYNNGNYIGIGTVSPTAKLEVTTTDAYSGKFSTNYASSTSRAIMGLFTGTGNYDAYGVYGESAPADYYGYGGTFKGGYVGVSGFVVPTGSNTYYGVSGAVNGGSGYSIGVNGFADGIGTNIAVYGNTLNSSGIAYGGVFIGHNAGMIASTVGIPVPAYNGTSVYGYNETVNSPSAYFYNGDLTASSNSSHGIYAGTSAYKSSAVYARNFGTGTSSFTGHAVYARMDSSSNSTAIYGLNCTAVGTLGSRAGVFGVTTNNTNTYSPGTNTRCGVYGYAENYYNGSNQGSVGVVGAGNDTASQGVHGDGFTQAATGIWGGAFSLGGTTNLVGVYGYSDTGGGGTSIAVSGENYNANAVAIRGKNLGTSGTGTGTGVLGTTDQTSGYGVRGENSRDNGVAVAGINTNAGSQTTTGIGVYGETSGYAASSAGVFGYCAAVGTGEKGVLGTYNTSGYGAGVLGVGYEGSFNSTILQDYGVVGSAGNPGAGIGVAGYYGAHSSAANASCGVYGQSNTSGAYAIYANNTAGSGGLGLYVNGTFTASGTKSAVVPTSQGYQRLYCTESPEVWFEDIGSGKLVNGQAVINLDNLFLETVTIDGQNPLHVFIQEEDFTNGLIVKPGATSFTVIEKNGGTSNASFSYRVMAKRRFYQQVRFGNESQLGNTVDWSKYHNINYPVDYNQARSMYNQDRTEAKQTSTERPEVSKQANAFPKSDNIKGSNQQILAKPDVQSAPAPEQKKPVTEKQKLPATKAVTQ